MGIIVSLSGVDNAGKSTQAKFLARYYRKHRKKVKVTEFAFGYYLLRSAIKYLRKATDGSTGGPVRVNNKPLLKLWFAPAFIDIWIGYLFYLRPLANKHDVVIADRFYTDIWVNLLYYGYCPKWAFEFFVKLLPKPDFAFVLIVKPKSGYGRENDAFPLEYYKKQVRIYKHLSTLVDCEVVNVEKDFVSVSKEIIRQISKSKQ